MDSTTLTERCQDWNQNLSIDESQRLVKNVALTGEQSKNGYTYSESSLKSAVPLYDAKPVFLDHARDRTRPHDRSTRDLVGSITNPRYDQGRIRGDIHVLETDSGKTFLKLLEMDTPGIGMSHVVKAKRSLDGTVVDEIVDVISVDAVVNPATTKTFSESTSAGNVTAEENTPLLNFEQQIETLISEQKRLQIQNSELSSLVQKLQTKQQVNDLLAESRLPDGAVTNFFISQLEATSDRKLQEQMIQDRLSLLTPEIKQPSLVMSRERSSLFESASEDDRFIQAIRKK